VTHLQFCYCISIFYIYVPVGHVEAVLRMYNIYSPYTEELNRQALRIVANYNIAPTEISKENLVKEEKNPETIHVTGNTAIDALKITVRNDYTH
jgi:UDP-N-acetylglucosamine 2-epimerase (non-hydrolysing)